MTSASGLAFGVYDTFAGTPLDSQLTVQVRCPAGMAPRLLLDMGSAPSFNPRTLRNGTETLPYNVFLDPGRAIVWGDGNFGTSAWDGPPGNSTLTAFGRIPPGQDVAVGDYADNLTLTVLF